MTSLPPYFQSSIEHQKWEDGFKAGLKELVHDIADIMEETTDPNTSQQLEDLIMKIDRRVS